MRQSLVKKIAYYLGFSYCLSLMLVTLITFLGMFISGSGGVFIRIDKYGEATLELCLIFIGLPFIAYYLYESFRAFFN